MSFTICCRVRRDKWRFFMPVLLRLISKTPYQSSTVASQAHRKLRHPWQYGVRPKTIRSQGDSGHGPYGVGAIKGAIDNAELGNLTGSKIKPAVAATTYTGERTSKNYTFVDAVARKNVEITIANIRNDSPVLAEMESNGAIKMAGAMYNLETGVVDFFAG